MAASPFATIWSIQAKAAAWRKFFALGAGRSRPTGRSGDYPISSAELGGLGARRKVGDKDGPSQLTVRGSVNEAILGVDAGDNEAFSQTVKNCQGHNDSQATSNNLCLRRDKGRTEKHHEHQNMHSSSLNKDPAASI
jgi:hypothetical protein